MSPTNLMGLSGLWPSARDIVQLLLPVVLFLMTFAKEKGVDVDDDEVYYDGVDDD